MLDDQGLIKQLNLGNKQALHQIYEKYRGDMFTVAVSVFRDKAFAEDCLQDVFVHFAEAAGRIRARSNLKAYLITSILNRGRDRLRRKSLNIKMPVEDLNLPDDSQGPAGQVIQGEQETAIVQAIDTLPAEQKEAFVLHAQGDMTFRQIARHQHVSARTAHSRYRYAVAKLQSFLSRGDQL